ncbi:MAG: DUF432 domain-containing protein [Sedimentisphaerales bacterium]|nr:DUF432 domain-containing protein [Sedimentisphaerales bacterium]
MDLWRPHRIEQDQCLETRIGPLKLWLRRNSDEIHIAAKYDKTTDTAKRAYPPRPAETQKFTGLDWGRWVCGDCDKVLLRPAAPDRPAVVRPELPIKIPSGQEALFFVGVPVWVQIGAGETGQVRLCEKPSVALSNIWFGDPMSGELCYSLRTRARRSVFDAQPQPHRAVCPVTIHNSAAAQVDVERFCIHVAHLSIYPGQSRLWTNGVRITYKGEAENTQLEYSKNPPDYEKVDAVLTPPRTPVKKSFSKISLGSFAFFGGA